MSETGDALLETLKTAGSALKTSSIPFAVAGSYAVYARGGPQSEHDVDILVKEGDVARAVAALDEVGMRAVQPSEDWLVKVFHEDRMVDLIFRPSERVVDDTMLARVDHLPVGAVRMPVLKATDLLVNKLLAFSEHYCDFAGVLPLARALREQIDWQLAAAETSRSPYAESFLDLCRRLDIAPNEPVLRTPILREVPS